MVTRKRQITIPVEIKRNFGTCKVNISDFEKTLADALDHPEHCGGMLEVAKYLWNAGENVAIEKIVNYAERMGNTAVVKRLGYLVESLNIDVAAEVLSKVKKMISPGMSAFDLTRPRKGRYNTRWSLLLNVSEETLEELRRNF